MMAAELIQPVNTTLYVIAFILEAAGLSPLLLATLGFLRTAGQHSSNDVGQSMVLFRVLGLIGSVGVGLSIYGGSNATSSDPETLKNSNTYRHVGTILFAVLYVALALLHVLCWFQFKTLTKNRRALLIAISCALPFLGIRVLYSILSSFSGSLVSTASSTPNTNSLAKFNMASGDWRIYLVMSVLMEIIATVIYTTAGTKIPLQQDYHLNASGNADEEHPLYNSQALSGYLPPKGQHHYPQGQTAYAPPNSVSYLHSQTPYATQEHIAYTLPPPQAFASKEQTP